MIFRFRKYSKEEYIIKSLKQNAHVFLEQNETYKLVAQDILKHDNVDCYSKFINEKYKDKYNLNEPKYSYKWKDDCKEDDINLNTKIICYHPPC